MILLLDLDLWFICYFLHCSCLPFINRVLDAGPIVVIVTLLVLIFTIGLSDDERNGLSAYSIFNRGFEKLMGSVDADALLAQHVGGGLGGGGMMNHNDPNENINANAAGRRHDARPQERIRDDHDNPQNDDGNQEDNNEREHDGNNNNNNRARKSGKKARRRDLQQRRDLREQREAALQMGLDGTEGPQEMMAMQRLIEEQIAAENGNE